MKLSSLKKSACALLAVALVGASLSGCASENGGSSLPSDSSLSSASSAVSETTGSSALETDETEYDFSGSMDENGLFEGITALDYVTLPDYKSIEVPAETEEISDDDVDTKANSIFSVRNKVAQITDAEVKDGDTVNIDYVGSIDGVEFAGGTTNGNGSDVTIGVTSFIDDFLEQLIGHKPGETVEVNVTFPQVYGKEELNGKDALFITDINYIHGEAPYQELNDDFVSAELSGDYGWKTVEEMKTALKEQLRISAVGSYLADEIVEKAKLSEAPQSLKDYHLATMFNYYDAMAKANGVTLDEFLEKNNIASQEDLVEKNQEAVDSNVKTSLVMQALAEKLGITVTDEDVKNYFRDEMGSADELEEYAGVYGMPYLKMIVREQLTKNQLAQ